MDNIRTNRTRRQRGYSWESDIVKRINTCNGWKALRLGSPSIGLPDVIAVNNEASIMLAIEAKSSSTDIIKIPSEQIVRCLRWLDIFARYDNRYIILALKFISKKWKGAYTYEHRSLQEYYKLWDLGLGIDMSNHRDVANPKEQPSYSSYNVICKYDGSVYYYYYYRNTYDDSSISADVNEKSKDTIVSKIPLSLKTFTMPWQML